MSVSSSRASILKAAAILLVAASAAGCLRGRPTGDTVDDGGGISTEESHDQGGSPDAGQQTGGLFEDDGHDSGGYEDDGGDVGGGDDFEDSPDDYHDDGFF
jgi:hypothetical protein